MCAGEVKCVSDSRGGTHAVHGESPLVFAWQLDSSQAGLGGAAFIRRSGEDGRKAAV